MHFITIIFWCFLYPRERYVKLKAKFEKSIEFKNFNYFCFYIVFMRITRDDKTIIIEIVLNELTFEFSFSLFANACQCFNAKLGIKVVRKTANSSPKLLLYCAVVFCIWKTLTPVTTIINCGRWGELIRDRLSL